MSCEDEGVDGVRVCNSGIKMEMSYLRQNPVATEGIGASKGHSQYQEKNQDTTHDFKGDAERLKTNKPQNLHTGGTDYDSARNRNYDL